MKALTLWQPWASLCVLSRPCDCEALGCMVALNFHVPACECGRPFKTIETRSWSASKALIGQRIAIHAAKRKPRHHVVVSRGVAELRDHHGRLPAEVTTWTFSASNGFSASKTPLPLGAVVGTAVLTDCVPIEACCDNTHHVCRSGDFLTRHLPLPGHDNDRLGGMDETEFDVSDQRPFGDFAPGRWAWLLADAVRFDEPIPARGGQRIWNWGT